MIYLFISSLTRSYHMLEVGQKENCFFLKNIFMTAVHAGDVEIMHFVFERNEF